MQKRLAMRQLLKKGVDFQWTDECESELHQLKAALVSAPVLAPITTGKGFMLQTDASLKGCGYCLLQKDDKGIPKPICYGGCSLTKAQQRWTIADLEIFSVCMALRENETYLTGVPVIVLTDNISVQYFHNLKLASNRLKRMATFLSQFDLDIRFIKGDKNVVADTLSRSFEEMSEGEKQSFLPKQTDDFIFFCAKSDRED
jgi:hypothetical protein